MNVTPEMIHAAGSPASAKRLPLPARLALATIGAAAATALGYHGYHTVKDMREEAEKAKGAKKAASFGLSPEDLLPAGADSFESGRASALRALGF